MIKRISFASRRSDLPSERFGELWTDALGAVLDAPTGSRPLRLTASTTLPELSGPDPKHDGIGLEWFADEAHLERFERWLGTLAGQAATERLDDVVASGGSFIVVADEVVMRGADWLDRRWREGGEKLKHMAIALRASDLTPAQFSERWRGRAGQVRRAGASETTAIPDEARGRAYVQNHPRPRASGEWAYDALNEVYFDDVESLRTRIEWFREHLAGQTEADLVRESWFLAGRELVLLSGQTD